MKTLQERFSVAGEPQSCLAEHAEAVEADVLMAALGKLPPLAAALWRAKYRRDPQSMERARKLLEVMLGHKFSTTQRGRRGKVQRRRACPVPPERLRALAHQVVCEWSVPNCTLCHGSGQVGTLGAMRRCRQCGGSGFQPPQHALRARNLGVSMADYHARWERPIARLMIVLDYEETRACGVLHQQLQVGTVHAPDCEPASGHTAATPPGHHQNTTLDTTPAPGPEQVEAPLCPINTKSGGAR